MNAKDYNERMMKGIFKKIYPVIARQIVEKTGVRNGYCIDLGGGPGMLGISIAMITAMRVSVCDMMDECVELARDNVREHDLQSRVTALQGMAENLPYPDGVADLVISRGSIFFWEDQRQGLKEVYRVLKPGGQAMIGGGFGTTALLREIEVAMAASPDWQENRKKRLARNPPGHFDALLEELSMPFTLEQQESGMWIHITKSPITQRTCI